MAKWKGCGHSVEMQILDSNSLSIIPFLEFRENNPDELCWKCWLKKHGAGRARGVAEKVKFQYEEPKEGQLTLGFVLHIVRFKQVKGLLPDAKIIGYVVSEPDDRKRGRR